RVGCAWKLRVARGARKPVGPAVLRTGKREGQARVDAHGEAPGCARGPPRPTGSRSRRLTRIRQVSSGFSHENSGVHRLPGIGGRGEEEPYSAVQLAVRGIRSIAA